MVQSFAVAADVYRCVDGKGRPAYTSNPGAYSNCLPANLKVTQPSADETSRAMERRQQDLDKEKEDEDRARQERELKAKEAAAEAALRQARAEEEAAKRPPPVQYEPAVPLGYYPYWGWGRGVVVPPLHHRRPDSGRDFKRDPGLPRRSGDWDMKSGPRSRH